MTAGSGCSWSAVSDATSWLHTSSSGSGNRTVSYTYDANTSSSSRTGHIVVGGQTFTVTQAAGSAGTTVQLSGMPYIQQCYDTADNFDGRWACAPVSAVMVLGFYNRIATHSITCTAYGNTPTHTSSYGFYVSSSYTYGSTTFSQSHVDPKGKLAYGAFGYIWKDDTSNNGDYVEPNLVGYLNLHDLAAQFIAQPSSAAAQTLVQTEIDAGRPLIARTYLTAGHYVVIVGYQWVGSTFKYLVNDPFGAYPYSGGYDSKYGQSEYEVSQPQAYSYAQMDLGNANGTRGLITIVSTATPTAATPTISPNGGSYQNSVPVTLACTTAGATIRYTTNGSDPTSSSTAYNGNAFTLTSSATVKAKAFATGYNASGIASASFTVTATPTAATPTISPNGGSYQNSVPVTLACTTAGATIRYTTNGSDPTSSSTAYNGNAFTLTSSATVKAKAFATGYNASGIASASFTVTATPTAATPTISPNGGSYQNSVPVTLACTTAGATIRYTTNGSDPTSSSTAYNGNAFTLTSSATVKAKAFATGYNASGTASASFTVTALPTYAVTYNLNGATSGSVPAAQTKTNGLALTLASNSGNLVKTGYTFVGWNTLANGSGVNYAVGANYTANAAVTLYAKWTANAYTVTFDAQGGSASSPANKIVTYAAAYGTLATTDRAGYTFGGWWTGVNGGGVQVLSTTTVALTANQTLYAKWVALLPQLSRTAVNVRENGEGRFFVKLDRAPAADTAVAVTKAAGGDASLSVTGGGTLTFTPTNWNAWQTVTLAAVNDADVTNGTASFRVAIPGLATQVVSATELDDDIGTNLALASSGSTMTGTGGGQPEYLIDGIHTASTSYGFAVWTNVPPGTMTLDMKAPTAVTRIRLLNYDWDSRVHRYTIESSLNGTNWSMWVDASTGAHMGWEEFASTRTARYLKFTGLSNSVSKNVCLAEWEVYGGTQTVQALSVSPSVRSVGNLSGITAFAVTNMGDGMMTYLASESESWLMIANGEGGTNRGMLTVSYEANPSTVARTGTVMVTATGAMWSPSNVMVVQQGATPVETWDVGYMDLGGGWRRLDWFGDYVPMGGDGWIWHNKHGFLLVASGGSPQSVWLFTNDSGWIWTSCVDYPFLYRRSPPAWLWYNGSTNPRWFLNMTDDTWETWP